MTQTDRRRHRRIALLGSFGSHLTIAALILAVWSWPASVLPTTWINHLWQSTLCAVAIAGLMRVFVRHQARVRYWLWFSASIKFLLPFSLLITLGGALPWSFAAPPSSPALSSVLIQIGQPFLDEVSVREALVAPPSGGIAWLTVVMLVMWTCGAAEVLRRRLHAWRHIQRTLVESVPVEIERVTLPHGVRMRATTAAIEPGVIGVWRPVILVPAGIERHLTPNQLDAVLAHECCHIRRHDNLLAMVHMLVEVVFWFHPLVWWIGGRLMQERERACDEAVLGSHASPRTYAEGIIRVCERYVETHLACVAGVSGSDLKKRIEAIMRHEAPERLSRWNKLALTSAAILTAIVPVIIGMSDSPRLLAQTQSPSRAPSDLVFDTASVKRNTSSGPGSSFDTPEGWVRATNVTTAMLIRFAYDLPNFQVSGGPDWLNSDRFDITARAEGTPSLAMKRVMLRRLLAERFKLDTHTEARDLPIYALVLARSDRRLGPQLRRSEADCTRVEQPSLFTFVGLAPPEGPPSCGFFGFSLGTNFPSGRGGFSFRGLTMPALTTKLIPMVRRTVVDETGLTGYFDADFDFLSELPPPPPPPGTPSPFTEPFVSVFTVFPEQLGLKLDSRRGPVDVLVVDRVEPPTEN